MKKLLLAIALSLGLPFAISEPASAQSLAQPTATVLSSCGTATFLAGRDAPLTVDTTGANCINGSISATNPSVSATGSAVPTQGTYVAGNKSGNLTGVTLDGSSNLNVNCAAGCAGGTFNNNSDAVATSATNGQTAAFLYGFNGTTFDRLRVDGNKYLNVDIQTITGSLPAGTAIVGKFGIDQTTPGTTNGVQTLSGSTTAVTGNVTVVQGTGTNLHTVTDATSVTTATLNAETTKVIGTVRVQGNVGGVMDAAGANQTAPANELITGCRYQATPAAVTDTNVTQCQVDAHGSGRGVIMDGAGNARAANVDASNNLGVVVGEALPAGSNVIGALTANQSVNVAQVAGTTTSVNNGAVDAGTTRVTIANNSTGVVGLNAGSNTVGNVVLVPSASAGGTSISTLTLANTTNATNVKSTAGQLYGISGFNMSSATPVWISLYNNSGTPTCGTSIIEQFMIPGNTTGAGFVYDFANPQAFSSGIAFCATTGIAGTGAPAATTYVVNIFYK